MIGHEIYMGYHTVCEKNQSNLFLTCPVFLWRTAGVSAEVIAEECRGGEMILPRYLSDGLIGLKEFQSQLHNGVDVDGFLRTLAVMASDNIREIACGNVEPVSIMTDASAFSKVLTEIFAEEEEQLIAPIIKMAGVDALLLQLYII